MRNARLAVALAAALLVPAAARADEWSETMAAVRAAVGSNSGWGSVDAVEKETDESILHRNIFQELYNGNHRELAFRFLNAAEARARRTFVDIRLAVARRELDVPAIEKYLKQDIDAGIAAGSGRAGDGPGKAQFVGSDPVFQEKLLPVYRKAFEETPQNRPLMEFLLRAMPDPAARLEILRQRLRAVPTDTDAAEKYLQIAADDKDFAAILACPPACKTCDGYTYNQVPALLALGRRQDAIDVLDRVTADLRAAQWKDAYTWIARDYVAAGKAETARAVALEFGRPNSIALIETLVLAGDKDKCLDAVRGMIRLDGMFNPRALFAAAEAIRPLDAALAEQAFDEAERRLLPDLKKDPNPLFNLSSDLRIHYERGRLLRLYELLIPTLVGDDERLRSFLYHAWQLSGKPEDAAPMLAFLQKHEKEFEGKWRYAASVGTALERTGKLREACEKYRAALALRPADAADTFDAPRLEDAIYRCLIGLKDYAACEAFLKASKHDYLLADLYVQAGQWDKAIEEFKQRKDFGAALALILEHKSLEAAAAYVQTLPADVSGTYAAEIAEKRGDTAGLVKIARMAVAANPRKAAAHVQLALRLFKTGKAEEARQEVRAAVALAGDLGLLPPLDLNPGCEVTLGDYWIPELIAGYDAAGQLPQLESDVAAILALTPAHRAVYFRYLASHYVQTRQLPAAISALEKEIALNPYQAAQDRETIKSLREKTH